jgi:hypothetical protein
VSSSMPSSKSRFSTADVWKLSVPPNGSRPKNWKTRTVQDTN